MSKKPRVNNTEETGQTVHDYTELWWGHSFVFKTQDGGMTGDIIGFGKAIATGDYIIWRIEGKVVRYQFTSISYSERTVDKWEAQVIFAPFDDSTVNKKVKHNLFRKEQVNKLPKEH